MICGCLDPSKKHSSMAKFSLSAGLENENFDYDVEGPIKNQVLMGFFGFYSFPYQEIYFYYMDKP